MKLTVFLILVFYNLSAQQNLIKLADSLMLNSDYPAAVKVLENAKSEYPNANLYLKLGICYRNLMRKDIALKNILEAEEIDNRNKDVLINLASIYSSLGNVTKAIEKFNEVYLIDSTNIFVKINLAALYLNSGDIYTSKSLYESLASNDSSNSFYIRQLASIANKEQKFQKSLELYEKTFAINKNDLKTIVPLAKLYYKFDMIDSAIDVTKTGLNFFTDETQLLKLLGDIYFNKKNFAGAVNAYVKLIAKGDESFEIYQKIGICYYQLAVENFVGDAQVQKLESAVEALNKSFSIDTTQSFTALYLGLAQKELGNNSEAASWFNKSIELLYPKYTAAIFTNLAIVYQRENNFSESIINFKKAMKFDSNNSDYYYYLASAYDTYYSDKNVPLIYYSMFLSKADSSDMRLINYARERIGELEEIVHFQNGSSSRQ
ncbi:MAG: hypothetical protein K9J16_14625 [Melioribacteraceae bacterium]|nr:hypothetical protein [Melioribacteraceae bacterium]MCF8356355.1 hypothetical protein [Melioribacteraceae bacterium]MCF8395794.1 hypothetical protein [Melioribacteraceae bacterium]MCF8420659.1 hypothetical protein [Melioribacteraceae bacterium]